MKLFQKHVCILIFFFGMVDEFVKACTYDDLVLLQVITRRGDSAPEVLYPNDPNPEETWKEGLDDLTMLGKFQPYALGCYLRSRYDFFVTSDPTEVQAMSSADPACVKSVQSLLASFYAPNQYWELVQNFSWQPIYIEQDKGGDEKYLSKPVCLAANAEHQRLLTEETKRLWPVYKNLIDFWQMNSGSELQNIEDVETLANTLFTEALYNLTIPEWALNYWDDLKYLHSHSFNLKFKSKFLQRLRGGPLVDLTVDKIKQKSIGGLKDTKVIVYGTHDFNIAAYLSAMGIWNGIKPNSCTTLIIEHFRQNNIDFVRYLYLNSTSPEREPQKVNLLTIPGCSEFCPLDYVIESTKSMIPYNWEMECQNL